MSDDSIKDHNEDRITRRDILQVNATLIAGILIFLSIFTDPDIFSKRVTSSEQVSSTQDIIQYIIQQIQQIILEIQYSNTILLPYFFSYLLSSFFHFQ